MKEYVVGFLAVLLSMVSTTAAPVPRVKPAPPAPNLAGDWVLHWNDEPCSMRLTADGKYQCLWRDTWWVGTWEFKEKTLTIRERVIGGETPWSWSVELDHEKRGRVTGSVITIRLEKVP